MLKLSVILLRFTALIMIVLSLVQCQSTKRVIDLTGVQKEAQEVYGKMVEVSFNNSKSHALWMKKSETDMLNPGNALEFGIYNVEEKKLIYKEEKYNAKVSWLNDTIVMVKSKPGVQSKDMNVNREMALYYINIKNMEKIINLDH